ncbi:MAG: response regulator [Desulfatiglandaceae bacterium]
MVEGISLEGKKILIVDDELDVLETLEERLEMCEISKAVSFDQARELLETKYFDFAILDIMGVDGYKLLEIANGKKVIAILLTAHALSPDNAVRARNEGAASYVPKAKINDIQTFLMDVSEAKAEGKSFWWRWHDRFGTYFDRRFGPGWNSCGEFWKESYAIKWEKYYH